MSLYIYASVCLCLDFCLSVFALPLVHVCGEISGEFPLFRPPFRPFNPVCSLDLLRGAHAQATDYVWGTAEQPF